MRAQFAPHPEVNVRIEEVKTGRRWPAAEYERGAVLLCAGL